MPTLKATLVSGFKWVVLGNVLQRLISVIAIAVLARRLEPAVFGVFALAFVAIDGLQLLQTLGLNAAIIQRQDLDDRAVHSAFTVIVITGLVTFALCFAAAPPLSQLFGHPEVAGVLRALGAVFILGCFSRIPNALLTRALRFRVQSAINFAGALLNSTLAVIFALISPTVWSLVLAYLIKQAVVTVLALYYSGYRPRFLLDRERLHDILGFGRVMVAVAVVTYVSNNADSVLVGRVLGAALLGYFTLAANVGDLVNKHFTTVISDVLFPAFARLQGDREQLRRVFLKSTRVVALLSFPFSVLLIVAAEPLVRVLYGARWLPTVPLLQLFGVAAIIGSLAGCSASLFRACGRPGYDLGTTLGRLLLRAPLLVLLAGHWSLAGAAWAGVIAVAAVTPVTLCLARRVVAFSWRDLASHLGIVAAAAAVMAAVLVALRAGLALPDLPALLTTDLARAIVLSAGGLGAFAATLLALDRTLWPELVAVVTGRGEGTPA